MEDLGNFVRALTREDLEGAEFPTPTGEAETSLPAQVRVARLSRFWQRGAEDQPALLTLAVADLLAGLHGMVQSWEFRLRGEGGRLECWYGSTLPESDWRNMLRGLLGDVRFAEDTAGPADNAPFRWACRCTGSPAGKPEAMQIERLCRTMSATRKRWAYVVRGEPVAAAEIGRLAEDTAERILALRKAFGGKNEPLTRPLVERGFALLERRAKRMEAARAGGLWRVECYLLAEDEPALRLGAGLLRAAFRGETEAPEPFRIHECREGSAALDPEPLSSQETSVLARPPREEFPGYELVEDARLGVAVPRADGEAVSLGPVVDRGLETADEFRLNITDLTKHALVAGVTGSGKTNTCFHLLEQLWLEHGIPFLVIEPAKREYRRLLADARWTGALKVFTAGIETLAPLRLSPFAFPAGTPVQSHIDYLKALFQASFEMYAPMPQILERALNEVYQDRGWDLARNENARGKEHWRSIPTLDDLIGKTRRLVAESGYVGELTANLEAALVTRLESLRAGGGKGSLFGGGGKGAPEAAEWFERPCVLELEHLVSEDEKAFVMGLVLIRLYEHHVARGAGGAPRLKHVTLIEEAHRLLREVPVSAGSEAANPRGQAIEVFANVLAEIRAYGEGIVIAEQIPSKLTRDIIKNTNLKVAHRLTVKEDRELLGGAMNLEDAAQGRLARLERGEAAVYAEGVQKPVLVAVRRSQVKDAVVGDEQVAATRAAAEREAMVRPAVADERLEFAFARSFHACVREPALIHLAVQTMKEFQRVYHRNGRPPAAAAAMWADLAGQEVERRAASRGWSHRQTDECVEQCVKTGALALELLDLTGALAREEGDRKTIEAHQETVFSSLSGALEANGDLWGRLHQIGRHAPFAGCVHCDQPCLYREAARPDDVVTEVIGPDDGEKIGALADQAADFALGLYDSGDTRSLQGSWLCKVVQQLDTPLLRQETQARIAQVAKAHIRRSFGEEEGRKKRRRR